ncbi:MAG: universal stress protein [Anderseniella sp.]|nr:universal stress protein [Anderseniella sp.]
MFTLMMVPVDLEHLESLSKALSAAAGLAKHYDIPVCYVGVANEEPSRIAHNPAEYEKKLQAFTTSQTAKYGHSASCKTFVGHDLVADVDDVLLEAVSKIEADLVVMASHVPTIVDYVWPSNGGKIAAHSKASVFVVR